MEALLIWFLVWGIVWGGVCAWLAAEKGRDATAWFIAGFIFNLIALLVLGFSPAADPDDSRYASPLDGPVAPAVTAAKQAGPRTRKCPDCAESVLLDARICRFCRYEFPPDRDLEPAPPVAVDGVPATTAELVPLGMWEVAQRTVNFAANQRVELVRQGTGLDVSRSGFTQSVHLPGAAVEESGAYLSVRTPYYPMLFAPSQGQSVPAAVAAITEGLA